MICLEIHTKTLLPNFPLDPRPKFPNFLNTNDFFNTLILSVYLVVNDHLHQIEPTFNNYNSVSMTLLFNIQDSI